MLIQNVFLATRTIVGFGRLLRYQKNKVIINFFVIDTRVFM